MNRSEIKKIGGSDIAAILGLSPWKSAHSLYLHLIGELPPQEDSFIMKRGRELEPDIARRFALDHPEFEVVEHGIVEDPEYPFLIGSPDRLLLQGGASAASGEVVSGLEVKTCDINQKGKWYNEAGEEDIPLPYYVQSLWYCGMLGLPDYHVAVDFLKPNSYTSCGIEYRHFEFSAEQYGELRERAVAFWHRHVIPKIPPEITEPDAATVEFYKHRPRIPEKCTFADDHLDTMIKAVMFRQGNLKEAERFFELEKTRLIAAMGDAEIIIDPHMQKKLVTYKGYETSSVDYKGLIAELGIGTELVDKYRKITQARRFVICK